MRAGKGSCGVGREARNRHCASRSPRHGPPAPRGSPKRTRNSMAPGTTQHHHHAAARIRSKHPHHQRRYPYPDVVTLNARQQDMLIKPCSGYEVPHA